MRADGLPTIAELEHARRVADGLDVRVADTELRRLGVSVGDMRAELAERLDVAPRRLGATRRRRRMLPTR